MQAAAFDSYAKNYDEHFTNSIIGRAQRSRVHHFSKQYIDSNLELLEINCGTGEDAFWLAQFAKKVIATDSSSEMIEVAKNKKNNLQQKNIEFNQAKFNQLHSVYSKNNFDIIFSNFGGLNCVSSAELKQLSKEFDQILKEKGKLIFVLMSSNCWIEKFYFKIKGKNSQSERRLSKDGVETTINHSTFLTYYYSPKEVTSLFEKEFSCIDVKPVGYFIPPSYLENQLAKRPFISKILIGLENAFAYFKFMANKADHFLIVLQKK